jgi:hypothetical protein
MEPLPPAIRRALPAAGVGAGLFALACALPTIGLLQDAPSADVILYQKYGDQFLSGLIPYQDYFVEYPPGSLLVFVLPSLGPAANYATLFQLLMALCGAVAIAALAIVLALTSRSSARLWGGVAFAALAPLILGRTVLDRFDLWPTALLLVALAAIGAEVVWLAFGALALGTCAKVFPVLMLPAFVSWTQRNRPADTRRGVIAFAIVTTVVVLPFLLLGPGGIRFSAKVATIRPTQVESLGGSFAFVADRLGILEVTTRNQYGSQNVYGSGVGIISVVSLAALLAAIVFSWRAFARGNRDLARLGAATLATVTGFVAFGKVLSPQYLIWLIPLAPLAVGRYVVPACATLAAALACTRYWFPSRFAEVAHLQSEGWVVLVRNILLVALFALAYASLRQGGDQITNSPAVERR